jgi:hypothetical protein
MYICTGTRKKDVFIPGIYLFIDTGQCPAPIRQEGMYNVHCRNPEYRHIYPAGNIQQLTDRLFSIILHKTVLWSYKTFDQK